MSVRVGPIFGWIGLRLWTNRVLEPCAICNGRGRIRYCRCPHCGGRGATERRVRR